METKPTQTATERFKEHCKNCKITKTHWIVFGCLCVLAFFGTIGFLKDLQYGTFDSGSTNSDTQHLVDEIAGPDNSLVRELNALNSNNAYQVGYRKGLSNFALAVQNFMPVNPSGYRSDLKNVEELKNEIFGMVSQNSSMNHVDPAVLDAYRNGWNRGFNQGMASPSYQNN